MGLKECTRLGVLVSLLIGLLNAQEDSLRSALNAVDRRQKEFSRYDDENFDDYGYSLDGPDDLAFLPQPEYNSESLDKNPRLERILLDYLQEGVYPPSLGRDVRKRISSSFRERLEEDKERQLEELAQSYLATSDIAPQNDDDDYSDAIKEIWDKYQNYPQTYNHPRVYVNKAKKRSYYPRLRPDKRSQYYQAIDNSPYQYYSNFQPESEPNFDYDFNRNRQYKRSRDRYDYPISKRSYYYPQVTHEHKRSTSKKDLVAKTDPKVAKDLSSIFGTQTTTIPTTTTTDKKPAEKGSKPPKKETNAGKDKKKADKKKQSKETFTGAGASSDKPLQLKKKSIDWSDYFGLDRRKKSGEDMDNEWLMERYHKAIALTSKRNAEYPLQSFKNHDPPARNKKEKTFAEDVKIAEIDGKLKSMEDTIIDDTLKYTGAHQGASDSQEMQEVKDRVISRLAAAYSLEKMRHALAEYKASMAQEQERQRNRNSDDYDVLEENKRVSVPRKQAIDEEKGRGAEGNNNIKCSQGDEDCDELNYRIPGDGPDQSSFDECPRIQRACSEVAAMFGPHGQTFETACNMHQMCLLCSNNSWFAPTRQCNVLFLTKAFELCDGREECQKEAQRSVKYLLEVNRSLRSQPMDECELACPDRR